MKRGRAGERESGRQRRSLAFVFSFLLSLSPTLPLSRSSVLAVAHKYHFSFAQLEYNAKEKTVEITLRVFADDLEAALSNRRSKSVKLDHKEAPTMVAEYVREKLALKGRDGRVKKLAWIGLEAKVDLAVLYLEAKMPEGMTGAQLRCGLLFELFDDQVNQVLLKNGGQKTSMEFKASDGFKPLSFPANP